MVIIVVMVLIIKSLPEVVYIEIAWLTTKIHYLNPHLHIIMMLLYSNKKSSVKIYIFLWRLGERWVEPKACFYCFGDVILLLKCVQRGGGVAYRSLQVILSHLLMNSLRKYFIFCAVQVDPYLLIMQI